MSLFRKVLISIVLCTSFYGYTQVTYEDEPVKVTSPSKMKSLARNAMKNNDAYLALHYYEQYNAEKPDDKEAIKNLASLYQITRNYTSAVLAYDKLYKIDNTKYLSALYGKGLMQKMIGSYDSAKVNLVEYKKLSKKVISKSAKKQLASDIKGCDSALFYMEFPERVEIENAGSVINNPHIDFGPIPVDSNKILYGSLTSDTIHFYDVTYDNKVEQPHRKFYTAEKNGDVWETSLLDQINDPEFEMGKIVYSAPSKTYYFSKCKKDSHGRTSCDLYTGKEKKNKSMDVQKLPSPINVIGSTSTQPSVYYDTVRKSDILYFVSNRIGGKGGLDIYYSIYNKRKKVWGKAKNLGGRVNTVGTDCTPFYDYKNRTLYFSSDGFPNMGGLDVFKSVKDAANRTMIPKNMGYPVNSPQDDLDFSLHQNKTSGYVVSNRPGGTPYMHETCCDDIFEVEILPELPFKSDIDFLVANSSGDSLQNDQLIVTKKDLKTGKVEIDTMLLAEGTKHLDLEKNKAYDFVVLKEGYKPDSYKFDTKNGVFSGHHDKKFNLVSLQPETPEVDTNNLIADVSSLETPTLALNDRSEVIVNKEIENTISEQIAIEEPESVDVESIEEPEVLEEKEEVVEIQKEEEKVVAQVEPEKEEVKEVVAQVEPKKEVLPIKVADAVIEAPKEVKEEPIVEKTKEVIEPKVEEEIVEKPEVIADVTPEKVVVANTEKSKKPSALNLLYEFDKFVLTSADKKEIDDVLISYMLQNPTSKVNISSHTDSRGSEIYNQYLSDQRMKQVLIYLESKGVSKDRVTAKGFGETKLKVKDTNANGLFIIPNCKLNRRTEVEIID